MYTSSARQAQRHHARACHPVACSETNLTHTGAVGVRQFELLELSKMGESCLKAASSAVRARQKRGCSTCGIGLAASSNASSKLKNAARSFLLPCAARNASPNSSAATESNSSCFTVSRTSTCYEHTRLDAQSHTCQRASSCRALGDLSTSS